MEENNRVAGTNQFKKGVSGNPGGRPKGSKNKITLLRLVAEEAAREDNAETIQFVLRAIIEDAAAGDKDMRKLVWNAVMSKGGMDDRTAAKDKMEININTGPKEEVTVIDATPEETQVEEIPLEQEEPDER